jgi:hypothetical protein
MITDEIEMVELLKVLQNNPEAAAKALAASGLKPDQVLNMGQMGIGQIAAPPSEAGISAAPPRYMGTFEGPAVRTDLPPSDKFTLPAEGEVPMAKPVVTTDATLEPDMDYTWNQALPIETAASAPAVGGWSTVATPEAGGQADLGQLMAGLKGLSPNSSDVKPIFGANAPAPKAMDQVKAAPPISMQQIMQMLLQGGGAQAGSPSLGALMRR